MINSNNPNFQKCVDEINEIGNEECEIELKKIKADELGEVKLPINTLSVLTELLEE